MSIILSFIMSHISSILPSILVVVTGLFAMIKTNQLKNERIKSSLVTKKAEGEKKRADIAVNAIKIINNSNIKTKKDIKDAIKKAKLDRTDFFN